ncbi:hypothetical protein K443DRAFT_673242 [Laccaria amethystina LaAM-08-1]|uniref:Uncharacterized protein n=1 Tax=Laccaria amethystina LaAM-08-1 TaxID=1095629 RepID=A0A0C9XRM3_9AGAR|nr:hypothetical protein K443DRAFT_673242 [Laccaria amethystina LaAM-08-1]
MSTPSRAFALTLLTSTCVFLAFLASGGSRVFSLPMVSAIAFTARQRNPDKILPGC